MGTSYNRIRRYKKRWDHPHACGDKRSPSFVIVSIRGSSPRVWGQDRVIVPFSCSILIIPTRVGTSHIGNSKHIIRPDHPHACGDKTLSSKSLKDCWGSSPRVWGQVISAAPFVVVVGIIPTRVGTRQLYIDRNDKL